MTFKLEEFNNVDYVIYKNNEKYYATKYFEKDGNTDLTTCLSNDNIRARID